MSFWIIDEKICNLNEDKMCYITLLKSPLAISFTHKMLDEIQKYCF